MSDPKPNPAPPAISDAEWEVMKILWARSPLAGEDVIRALEPRTTWKPKTILTLINRLVRKGALSYEKKGRAYLYYPAVAADDCVRAENRSFLQRVYDGALKPMLVNFLQDAQLSKKEIAELKRLLDERSGR